jgi:hypothetical protein
MRDTRKASPGGTTHSSLNGGAEALKVEETRTPTKKSFDEINNKERQKTTEEPSPNTHAYTNAHKRQH